MNAAQQARYQLANQILDLVIESRFEPGHHLREQQLAAMLGVSRTPVRSALALLAERGALESVRNKGYFLRLPADQLTRMEVETPPSAAQRVYARIMQDRIAGALTEEVSITELARNYDADRAMVRNVLAELERDGLVNRGPGRNWTFLPTMEDMETQQASYEYRLLLEPQGILLPGFRADKAALDRLRLQHLYVHDHPNLNAGMGKQLFELDATFHETIAEFSRNPFLLQAIQHQNRLRRLLEFATYSNRARIRAWCREHVKIIDAVATGQLASASELMAAHLRGAQGASAAPATSGASGTSATSGASGTSGGK